MKVAVLAHSFPRFPGDTHGPFVKDLCEAMTRLGHELHVLLPFDTELQPDPTTPLKISSFRYVWPDDQHVLGYSRTLRADVGMRFKSYALSPLYFAFAQRALAKLVREQGIDLIHAHWLLPNGWVAAQVSRATGVPFAVTLHGSDVFMAEKNFVFRAMARYAIGRASHITSCSDDLRQRLVRIAGDGAADTIRLLANGTRLNPDRPTRPDGMRRRLGITDDDRLVVAVGRLVYKKGFDVLLRAWPEIVAGEVPARLVIGGGGDLQGELQGLASGLGLAEPVVFTGGLQHDEVLDLIAAADIFVMPSVRDPSGNIDGLPIVVLEAMAAARPVVATDVAGMPLAIADGVSGVLVPEKDPPALASAIRALLAEPERGQELGAAARRRVIDELNWDAIAARHDELYRAAVSGRRDA